jgi:hypothetical protein
MAWREVIVSLQRKLVAARHEVVAHGEEELADKLAQASAALEDGRFADYRRLVSLVVSRLGHLKD